MINNFAPKLLTRLCKISGYRALITSLFFRRLFYCVLHDVLHEIIDVNKKKIHSFHFKILFHKNLKFRQSAGGAGGDQLVVLLNIHMACCLYH